MKRINTLFLYFIVYSFLSFNNFSFSQGLVVDITEGNVKPLKIALSNFVDSKGNENEIGENIVRVITNDLVSSGLFEATDQKAFIDTPKSPRIKPNFINWSPLGVKALITGSANIKESGIAEVEFRLWDVVTEQDITGLNQDEIIPLF